MEKKSRMKPLASFLAIAAFALGGCSAQSNTEPTAAPGDAIAEMEPLVIRYSDPNAPTASHATALQAFMERVTAETEGKVTFETHFSGVLHPGDESLSALESGMVDMTFVSPSYLPDLLPAGVWNLQLAQSRNASFPEGLVAHTPVQMELYASEAMTEELEHYDATLLATWGSMPFDLLCAREVRVPEDLSGASVRTAGAPWVEEVEAFGMTNVFLPAVDVYEGLQRGVIDCSVSLPSIFMTTGIWEVAKYYIPANFGLSLGSSILMNKSVYDALPVEVQRVIFDARIALVVDIVEVTMQRYVEWATEAPGKGVTFVDPAPFNDVLEGLRAERSDSVASSAPSSVRDPEAFIELFEELSDEWSARTEELGLSVQTPKSADGWIDAYLAAQDIDWGAYEEEVADALAGYRP